MSQTRYPEPSQVLVVGAGPVGLFAALRLSQQGVRVRLVEQQSERTAHSFPVVIHPRTLALLLDVGVSAPLFWRGRSVTRLAVYTEYERRAVLDFPELSGIDAGLLTLPQDILRQVLSSGLERFGVAVEWGTRLAGLEQDGRSVRGRLMHHEPRFASGIRIDSTEFEAEFVIGADGYQSAVREALGLRLVDQSPLQSYAFFDATTGRAGSEAQLSLTEDFGNSSYPLQGGQTRFSFQLGRSLDRVADLDTLSELLLTRMPWFAGDIVSLDWSGIAEFRRALVDQFGRGRVWLAGEAAHLTGPLGVHSLNVGMDEANELALRIASTVRRRSEPDFGATYDAGRRRQWRGLLGLDPPARVTARSPQWARRHLPQLISALPASDGDLEDLLSQLRLSPSTPP